MVAGFLIGATILIVFAVFILTKLDDAMGHFQPKVEAAEASAIAMVTAAYTIDELVEYLKISKGSEVNNMLISHAEGQSVKLRQLADNFLS